MTLCRICFRSESGFNLLDLLAAVFRCFSISQRSDLVLTSSEFARSIAWVCVPDCVVRVFSMPLFNARSRSMCMNGYIGLLAPMRIELFGWTSSARVSHLTEFMRRCHWPWMKSVHWCLHLSLGCPFLENMILFYQGYPLRSLFKASYTIKMQSPIE